MEDDREFHTKRRKIQEKKFDAGEWTDIRQFALGRNRFRQTQVKKLIALASEFSHLEVANSSKAKWQRLLEQLQESEKRYKKLYNLPDCF